MRLHLGGESNWHSPQLRQHRVQAPALEASSSSSVKRFFRSIPGDTCHFLGLGTVSSKEPRICMIPVVVFSDGFIAKVAWATSLFNWLSM